ncbi:MAG: nitroreductase [Clostridiales bacterium]|jgi:nitroreductase|nr:nitroreductase [Clostridiales bacterium]
MDTYEAIYSRRSIRDFEDKEIDIEIVKRIINAGIRAPTNNHMREWEFIIIDKESRLDVIKKVSKNNKESDAIRIIDNWGLSDGLQRDTYIDAIPKQHKMLLTSACLIIPCFRNQGSLLKPKNLSALNSFASIWCCIENMLIAASSEGIYGVTRIPFDKEITHIREMLDIPEDYEFPCYLALGYPSKDEKPIPQHFFQAEDKMHYNKW